MADKSLVLLVEYQMCQCKSDVVYLELLLLICISTQCFKKTNFYLFQKVILCFCGIQDEIQKI